LGGIGVAKKEEKKYLWKDRKRTFLGLPWSFTKYSLDEDKLYIKTGFFNSTEDEVRLYRITDLTLKRSLGQKMCKLGTIRCDSSDVTMQNFAIKNIKNSKAVKDMLSELVEKARIRNRVYTTESVNGHPVGGPGGPIPPGEIDMTDANNNGIPDVFEHN